MTSRAVATAALAALVLATFGCSDSSRSDASKQTGDAQATTTTGVADPSTTVVRDPAEFDSAIAELTGRLATADGDLCGLMAVLDSAGEVGDPTSPEQAKTAGGFLADAYTRIADAAPDNLSAEADRIRTGSKAILDEVDQPGFDAEAFLTNGPAAFRDSEFLAAVSKLFETVQKTCGGG